jgi:acetate kinase
MNAPILVINAGSSSIKFSIFETSANRTMSLVVHGQVDRIGQSAHLIVSDDRGRVLVDQAVAGKDHAAALAAIHDWFARRADSKANFDGVGHRVVHGGMTYVDAVLIDERVIAELAALSPLAPLHQPHNISAIRAMATYAPHVPQVACFDTAFHSNQPAIAREYGLPRLFAEKGIRSYGFHGLSYEYIVSALPELAPECADGKLVIAHLGNGASMCAVDRGRSVATTMGFSPVEGLLMGTRSGSLDPGVILYLLQHEGMDARAVEHLLYEQSGLLGMSGVSSDMRDLLASDAASAKEAIDLFVYRIRRELGSLVAALGGLDALIFTAGIGEHAPEIRARVCGDARWLDVVLDEAANARNKLCISAEHSAISVWVIPTDENMMIARHTRRLLDRT